VENALLRMFCIKNSSTPLFITPATQQPGKKTRSCKYCWQLLRSNYELEAFFLFPSILQKILLHQQ
jgi:hypothetical protein